jgi:hypothetical protein
MNEDVLYALGRLFAIVSKQDGGVTEKERQFVTRFFQLESNEDSIRKYLALYDAFSVADEPDTGTLSVRDVVAMLHICRKLNATLTPKQKVIVVMKLVDLVWSCKSLSLKSMVVVNTISAVLGISEEEYKLVHSFVRASRAPGLKSAAA